MPREFEQYRPVFTGSEDINLRPGKSAVFEFNADHELLASRCRLYFTGETVQFYLWKNEPDSPTLYKLLDDALDSVHAHKAQFCLNLSADDLDYPKRAYKKLYWPPRLSYLELQDYTDFWKGGLFIKAERLRIHKGGYLRMLIEVRHTKEGVSRHSILGAPDTVYTLDFPQGSYSWRELSQDMVIPSKNTANVCVFIEGEHYSGKVYAERPFITSSKGVNILPDLSLNSTDRPHYNWMGQNLSRKEWPEFDIKLNGKRIYKGEVFERAHRYSETEKDIPAKLIKKGRNRLEIKLISSWRDALPYNIHQVGLVTRPDNPFDIVACPENAPMGRPFSVLIETKAPMLLEFVSDSGIQTLSPLRFEGAGLHALQLMADTAAADAAFTLTCKGHSQSAVIKRILYKPEDEVLTGTGDQIYINQNIGDMSYFLSWYLANNIGNLFTIRPVYRWSGTRTLQRQVWQYMNRLLNALGLKYVHMLDGRELPGSTANPTAELLKGEHFLGRQKHETDGAYVYWGFFNLTGNYYFEMYFDLWTRYPDSAGYDPEGINYIMKGERVSYLRDPDIPKDMKAGADFLVSQLSRSRKDATRHTGPSVMFKYFLQAGFTWAGSELMYGPMEPVIAVQRGASACYGYKRMGGHLAVQWSTTPHDTPERLERYRLALYVSYIQGLTDINTEEGLWHIEEHYNYFNRFSYPCSAHKKVQQDFYRYVSSHWRTGEFYTPFAFLHGRYDAWQCFGRGTIWGHTGMYFDKPEESWDLLNIFYPLSLFDAIYRHPCNDGPVGFYTGTPLGNADIIPIEGPRQFSKYKALSFLGYNSMQPEDCGELYDYINGGRTLILGWPHLAVTTDREDVIALRHEYIEHELVKRITGLSCRPQFITDTLDGQSIETAEGINLFGCEPAAQTDSGRVLAFSKNIGKGKVYFINAKGYPAEPALRPVYERVIKAVSSELIKAEEEKGIVYCGNDVQYAVYTQSDGSRHIYLLAVDWYAKSTALRSAQLRIGVHSYNIAVPADRLLRLTVKDGYALWADNDSVEILSLQTEGRAVTAQVQGYGESLIFCAIDGALKEIKLDFNHEPQKQIEI